MNAVAEYPEGKLNAVEAILSNCGLTLEADRVSKLQLSHLKRRLTKFHLSVAHLYAYFYFNRKISVYKVARIFDCSASNIQAALRNAGYQLRQPNNYEALQPIIVFSKYQQGASVEEIAALFCVSYREVKLALQRHPQFTEIQADKICSRCCKRSIVWHSSASICCRCKHDLAKCGKSVGKRKISERDREILEMKDRGMSVREIAFALQHHPKYKAVGTSRIYHILNQQDTQKESYESDVDSFTEGVSIQSKTVSKVRVDPSKLNEKSALFAEIDSFEDQSKVKISSEYKPRDSDSMSRRDRDIIIEVSAAKNSAEAIDRIAKREKMTTVNIYRILAKEREDNILREFREGVLPDAIASAYNLDRKTVYLVIFRNCVELKVTPEADSLAIKLYHLYQGVAEVVDSDTAREFLINKLTRNLRAIPERDELIIRWVESIDQLLKEEGNISWERKLSRLFERLDPELVEILNYDSLLRIGRRHGRKQIIEAIAQHFNIRVNNLNRIYYKKNRSSS